MTRSRLAVLVLALLIALPAGRAAEETPPAHRPKPGMWLAARSFNRLEQRFRESIQALEIPGLDLLVIGIVLSYTSHLEGLDRERPIALGFSHADPWDLLMPDLAGDAQVFASIPYSDGKGILATLERLLRQEVRQEANGEIFIEGGHFLGSIHGRRDEASFHLVLTPSPSRRWLDEIDFQPPPDLFPASGGPDLLLLVDLSRTRGDASLAEKLPEDWERRFPADITGNLASGYRLFDLRKIQQEIDSGEVSLTLLPEGWFWEIAGRLRPGSALAKRFERQMGRPARAEILLDPSASFRGTAGVRLDEEVRGHLRERFLEWEQTSLAEGTRIGEAERGKRQALFQGLREVQEALLRGDSMEVGFEGWENEAEWISATGKTGLLEMVLSLAEEVRSLWPDQDIASLERNAASHDGIPLHRLRLRLPDLLSKLGAEPPATDKSGDLWIAERHEFLVFQGGPEGLTKMKSLLDRIRREGSKPSSRTDAAMHLEFSASAILELLRMVRDRSTDKAEADSSKRSGEAGESISVDLVARKDGGAIRIRVPTSIIKAIARIAAEGYAKDLLRIRIERPAKSPPERRWY